MLHPWGADVGHRVGWDPQHVGDAESWGGLRAGNSHGGHREGYVGMGKAAGGGEGVGEEEVGADPGRGETPWDGGGVPGCRESGVGGGGVSLTPGCRLTCRENIAPSSAPFMAEPEELRVGNGAAGTGRTGRNGTDEEPTGHGLHTAPPPPSHPPTHPPPLLSPLPVPHLPHSNGTDPT